MFSVREESSVCSKLGSVRAVRSVASAEQWDVKVDVGM